MDSDDQIAELFRRWKIAQESGTPQTAEDLCHACPELLSTFREILPQLAAMDALFDAKSDESQAAWSVQIDANEYRSLRFHKAGGLGVVLKGEDVELSRTVAIKCMKSRYSADSQAAGRFLQEAEITAKLDHPGVVPIYRMRYDVQGQPYYAMRFIEGKNLGEAITQFHTLALHSPERNKKLQSLIDSLRAVCNTVAFAHSRSVIHRDLKPENIILGAFGETIVIDWGLAKLFGVSAKTDNPDPSNETTASDFVDGVNPTLQGTVKGSPAFMSPEQASGEIDSLGPASDIYSLGSTLFVLLTGKSPYTGDDPIAVAAKVKTGVCLSPRELNPEVDRPLEAICKKAMSKEPEDRYLNALDMAEDLKRWQAGDPVSVWPEPLSVRLQRWTMKHRTFVATIGMTTLVATVLLALFASRLAVEKQKLVDANRQLSIANAKEIAARAEAERHFQLAVTQIGELSDTFSSPEMSIFHGDPVYRIMSDVLLAQMNRLAEETASNFRGELFRCQVEVFRLFVMGNSNPVGFSEDLKRQIEKTRSLLEAAIERDPSDDWSRVNLAKIYLQSSNRMIVEGLEHEAHVQRLKAFDLFIQCASPDTDLGRRSIEAAAMVAPMFGIVPTPTAYGTTDDALRRIDLVLQLVQRAEKSEVSLPSSRDRFLYRISISGLLQSKASVVAALHHSEVETLATAQAAVDELESVADEWKAHPLFFRARAMALCKLGEIQLVKEVTLDGWDVYARGADDVVKYLQALPAVPSEPDRRFAMFTFLALGTFGAELAPMLARTFPSDAPVITLVTTISSQALDNCESLELQAPDVYRDPRMTESIRAAREALKPFMAK